VSILGLQNFKRITAEGVFSGVCAGLAYWIGIPTWIVRVLWGGLCFCYGVGFVPYLLLWFFLPEWDETPRRYAKLN